MLVWMCVVLRIAMGGIQVSVMRSLVQMYIQLKQRYVTFSTTRGTASSDTLFLYFLRINSDGRELLLEAKLIWMV